MAFLASSFRVIDEVKTAMGVHLIKEPLLWDLSLFTFALSIANLAFGFYTVSGTRAALVLKPMSKGGLIIQFLY